MSLFHYLAKSRDEDIITQKYVLVQPQSHPSTIFRSYGAGGVNEDTKILRWFIVSYEQ